MNRLIAGIICNKCGNTLPPHSERQHLDVNHPIHDCPHNYTEDRLIEDEHAYQLAQWRKNPPPKEVCDYLDKNLPGWRNEPDDN